MGGRACALPIAKVKPLLQRDRRYDGVRSSSRREALFDSYVRELAAKAEEQREEQRRERDRQQRCVSIGRRRWGEPRANTGQGPGNASALRPSRLRVFREVASLRDRADQVRRQREVQLREADRSLHQARREESLQTFKSMLVELVKSHEVHRRCACLGGVRCMPRLTTGDRHGGRATLADRRAPWMRLCAMWNAICPA